MNLETMNYNEKFHELNLNCLIICPSCYSIPKISILFEQPVQIYIQCNCIKEDKEVLLLSEYIEKLQLLRLKNNIIKGSGRIYLYYCKDCNQWLYNIGNNEHKQHQVSDIMLNEPHSCGKHNLSEYEYYCIDCKRHLCLTCYKLHEGKHNLKNLQNLKKEITNNQMYKRIKDIENIFNDRNDKFIEAAMKSQDESIINRIKQTIEDNLNLLKIAKIIYYSYCFLEPFNNFKIISNTLNYSIMILDTYPSSIPCLGKYWISETHSLNFFWTFETILKIRSNRNKIMTFKEDAIILPNIVVLSNERIFFGTKANRLKVFNLRTYKYELNSNINNLSTLDGIFTKWEDNKILYRNKVKFEVFEITNNSTIISCFTFHWSIQGALPLSNNIIVLSNFKDQMEIWDIAKIQCIKTFKDYKSDKLLPLLRSDESSTFLCKSRSFFKIFFFSTQNFKPLKSINLGCDDVYQLKNHKILLFTYCDGILFYYIIDNKTLCTETIFEKKCSLFHSHNLSNYFNFCNQYCLANRQEDFSFIYFEKTIYKRYKAQIDDPIQKYKKTLAIGYRKLLSYEGDTITIWMI